MRKLNTDLPEYIFQSSITPLIDLFNEDKEDKEVPWNTFGGSVYAGQRLIDFLNEDRDFKISANVSGIVASMGVDALPFFDSVRGAKQSDLMVHSVSGGSNQEHTNEFFYKALAEKIDEDKFKEVTGHEFKTVMLAKESERIDVWITGEKAGYIGFYDETYNLLDKAASIKDKVNLKELGYELPENIKHKYGVKKIETKKNDMEIKDVTADALEKGNKEVYTSISEKSKKAEQNRVAEIMKYAQYDIEKANEIIKSGEKLSTEHVEHFMEKKFNTKKLADFQDNSEEDINPAKTTKNEEVDKEKVAFDEEITRMRDDSGVNEILKKNKI